MNDIKATANLIVYKDGFDVSGNGSTMVDMSGSRYSKHRQIVNTSYVPLDIGNLTNLRYIFINNLSTGNVSVSMHSTSQSFAILEPSDVILLPQSGSFTTYQVKSTVASSSIGIVVTEQ